MSKLCAKGLQKSSRYIFLKTDKMKLSRLSSQHLPQACALYESSFPKCERRPTTDWLKMIEGHKFFHAWEVTDSKGFFCGFITAWTFPSFTYVEHFAITPVFREKGIGGRVLDIFTKRQEDTPVILEVEPPVSEMSRRRIKFYQRHKFSLIHCAYFQPPYYPGAEWIKLCVMTTKLHFAERHFEEIRQTIHREVYGAIE